MPRLTLNTSDFVAAIRPMLKASKRSAASEVTFSYVRGDLVIVCAGVEVSAPASGDWQGTASTHKSVLRLLAKLKGGTMDITFTDDGRLHVGPMSFDARWHEGALPPMDLPIDPPLHEVLRLRRVHSDEALLVHGLLERVVQAEVEAARRIEIAVHGLQPLGDFRAAVFKLVWEAFPKADLPLGHSLLQALRLRRDHSDAELRALGLLARVTKAEAERDDCVDSAVSWLKPLGDFRSAINALVGDALERPTRSKRQSKPDSQSERDRMWEGTTYNPPPPYGPTRPEISREEARAIAEQHVVPPATGIGEVLAFDELQGRRVTFYNTSGEPLEDCWIAYVQRPVRGLFSSTIIVISRRTGRVVHIGSAGDEG